jgi:hypothetical protein
MVFIRCGGRLFRLVLGAALPAPVCETVADARPHPPSFALASIAAAQQFYLEPNSPAQPPRPIACWPAEDLGSADTQHYRRTVGPLRHVAFEGFDIFADVLDRRIKFRLAASGDENASALPDKTLGCGEPDPAAAAGDQGDFAIKLALESPPLLSVIAVQGH